MPIDRFARTLMAAALAAGHWNGEKGATHAQNPLGDDFRLKKGGCWTNARATVCASR